MSTPRQLAIWRKARAKREARFAEAGLTTRGKEYQRHPNFIAPWDPPSIQAAQHRRKKAHNLIRNVQWQRDYRAQRVARRLTMRGTVPKFRKPLSALEKLHQQIRSEIKPVADCYYALERAEL